MRNKEEILHCVDVLHACFPLFTMCEPTVCVSQVEVLYGDEPLKDYYTLMDIAYFYEWRRVSARFRPFHFPHPHSQSSCFIMFLGPHDWPIPCFCPQFSDRAIGQFKKTKQNLDLVEYC